MYMNMFLIMLLIAYLCIVKGTFTKSHFFVIFCKVFFFSFFFTDALTVKVKDESKPIVAELTHTLTSMRTEFNKLTPEDKTSAEYTEVVVTYKLREVSLLITLENMDGKESISKFCEYCFQQADLSCKGQQLTNVDLEVVAQFQELREKWSSALTENNKCLPFTNVVK